MKYEWKIGDEFKMVPIKGVPKQRCLFPKKTFIVEEVTMYLVRYIDNRTNIKCTCRYCVSRNMEKYNYATGEYEKTMYKEVDKEHIILVRTKNQRQREITLKILNI